MKGEKVTGSSQRGFTEGQLRLTNLMTSCNETTACVDNRRALGIVLIDHSTDFIKASDAVSPTVYTCRQIGEIWTG